jgi:hypothetical protein
MDYPEKHPKLAELETKIVLKKVPKKCKKPFHSSNKGL